MKVKQLIELLQKQDPEMDVYIQAEVYEYDYMIVQSVRKKELLDIDNEDEVYIKAVVIDYQ